MVSNSIMNPNVPGEIRLIAKYLGASVTLVWFPVTIVDHQMLLEV